MTKRKVKENPSPLDLEVVESETPVAEVKKEVSKPKEIIGYSPVTGEPIYNG